MRLPALILPSASLMISGDNLAGPANKATVIGDTIVQQRTDASLLFRLISSYTIHSDGK